MTHFQFFVYMCVYDRGKHTLEISEAASENRLPVCGWPLVVAPAAAAAAAAARVGPAAAPPPPGAPSDHCKHNVHGECFVLFFTGVATNVLDVTD